MTGERSPPTLPLTCPGCPGSSRRSGERDFFPRRQTVQRELPAPQQHRRERTGRGGPQLRAGGSGTAFPAASRACPAPHLPRRDPGPDRRRRGRIRGAAAAAAAARRCERRRREAASGSPGCDGRAGAVRTGAPRCCRCPGRGGDAAAGDSERLFGSVRKVTAATRPTLNPPPRRTWGREKEEERGRRQGWGLAADQSPAQHQVTAASLGLSLRCSEHQCGSAPLGFSHVHAAHGASFRALKLSPFQ